MSRRDTTKAPAHAARPERVYLRDNTMLCLYCGDSTAVSLPLQVDVFMAMLRAYRRVHTTCEPKGGE